MFKVAARARATPDATVLKSLCRALLVLNVLYCALATVQEGLPGWHMFESVEPLDYTLRDRDGALVDLSERLPAGARLTDYSELVRVVSFVCEHDRARAPFTFEDDTRGVYRTLGPEDCAFDAGR